MGNTKPSGWTHIVLNYLGPGAGQGIEVYQGGVLAVRRYDFRSGGSRGPGDGRTVLGRFHTEVDGNYGGFVMDELLFFNNKLSAEQVEKIHRN